MKGITLCAECTYYDKKKHRCKRGASKERFAIDPFYDDCPLPDVVEVVRCKDCKYCIPATADGAEYELCIVDDDVFPVSVQKQHFCSRGKRKEE